MHFHVVNPIADLIHLLLYSLNGVFLRDFDWWARPLVILHILPSPGKPSIPFIDKGAAHGIILQCIFGHRFSFTRHFTETYTKLNNCPNFVGSMTSILKSVAFTAASLKHECSVTRNSNDFFFYRTMSSPTA